MICFNDVDHGFRIAAVIPRIFNPSADKVISRTDGGGRLLGGVIYEGCIDNSIFMHQGSFSKNWLSADMLWVVFDFPFNQLGVEVLCGTVPSAKPELIAFNEKLGFKVECSIKGAYKDGDLVIMTMRRPDCRWLSVKPKTIRSNRQ